MLQNKVRTERKVRTKLKNLTFVSCGYTPLFPVGKFLRTPKEQLSS